METYVPYDSPLEFEFIRGLETLKEFRVRITSDRVFRSMGRSILVPEGFITDLASTPRIIWSFIPPFGPWSEAAVVHDRLYLIGDCTRLEADQILRDIMRQHGVSRYVRSIIYSGVRVGGWRTWNRYRKSEKRAKDYSK